MNVRVELISLHLGEVLKCNCIRLLYTAEWFGNDGAMPACLMNRRKIRYSRRRSRMCRINKMKKKKEEQSKMKSTMYSTVVKYLE